MNIGQRIKHFRKEVLRMTQQDFASNIMFSRSNLGNVETGAVEATDRLIASICDKYKVNENWLRNGIEPIYKEKPVFILDEFLKSRNAMEIEIEILKAYFDLDLEIRRTVVNHFKEKLSDNNFTQLDVPQDILDAVPDSPEEFEKLYPVASTKDNHDVG